MTFVASSTTVKEMEDVFRIWEKQGQTGDAANLAGLMTDDCTWQAAGMPPAHGKEACLQTVRTLMAFSTDGGSKPLPKDFLKFRQDPHRVFVDNVENPRLVISPHDFIQKLADGTGGEPIHGQCLDVYVRAPANSQVKWLAKIIATSMTSPPTPQLEAIMRKMPMPQGAKTGTGTTGVRATGMA